MDDEKKIIWTSGGDFGVDGGGSIGLWYHSRANIDVVKIGQTTLAAKDGSLAIQHPTMAFHKDPWLQWQTIPYDMANDPIPAEFRPKMFGYFPSMELKDGWQRTLIFPLWLAAIVLGILPALWI